MLDIFGTDIQLFKFRKLYKYKTFINVKSLLLKLCIVHVICIV